MTNITDTTVQFIQNHLPPLTVGQYTVTVDQSLEVGSDGDADSASKQFWVAGERHSIQPAEIQAVYPPANASSDYSTVIPYLALNRITLPWERMVDGKTETTPWLALLLFSETETAEITASTVPVTDLVAGSDDPYFAAIALEPGEADTGQVQVIDVPLAIAQPLIGAMSDLDMLVHVRHSTSVERPYIMTNRLPLTGVNTVHLVSLEDRFADDGSFVWGSGQSIRFVTLYSWSFTSIQTFKVSQGVLDNTAAALGLDLSCMEPLVGQMFDSNTFGPAMTAALGATYTDNQVELDAAFNYGDFATILQHTDRSPSTLRMPANADAQLETLLDEGCCIMPHKLREGSRSAGFYHGPCTPSIHSETLPAFPVRAADQLLLFHSKSGMFDVSYAAAWEIGRLQTLQDPQVSTELQAWKLGHAHTAQNQQQVSSSESAHLPGAITATPVIPPLPASVSTWFDELRVLKHIPFNYLVPEEDMLPAESLRFFYLDNHWISALFDGALSIGRTTTSDHKNDQPISDLLNDANKVQTGFFLRSTLVPGWPDLIVDGYSATTTTDTVSTMDEADKLTILRMETVSANVLLVLFDGEVKTVDFHLPPETVNYGVENNAGAFQKKMRDTKGIEQENYTVDVPVSDGNVIIISQLVNFMDAMYNTNPTGIAWSNPPSSANLGLNMLEGGQRVRFVMSGA